MNQKDLRFFNRHIAGFLAVLAATLLLIACQGDAEEIPATAAAVATSPTVVVLPTATATQPAPTPTELATATQPPAATAAVTEPASAATSPAPGESNTLPHVQLVNEFLSALKEGLTAADSGAYLTSSLQAAAEDGRPLPTLVGIRDVFPSYALTDITDNSLISGALVRARFEYDFPTYAVFRLIREDGDWRINNVAQHNLVRSYSSRDLLAAEATIIGYYQAVAQSDIPAAAARLTGEAQDTFDVGTLESLAAGLSQVTVTTLQPVRANEDQINYYVRLYATTAPDPASHGPWLPGDNPRWLTVVRMGDGWRIARIINSPILADIKTWQRVSVLPINMTLDIPSDWIRAGVDWAWSPNSLGIPGIGVSWADLGDFGGDEAMLPRARRAITQQPVDLGWAQGTQYTFEQLGGIGEGAISAESHIIVRTGRRAYDFYAVGNTVEELDNLRPVLQRMVAAVAITDPEARAFNSVETTTSFLAALLRDPSGASSLPYLSQALQAGGVDRQAQLQVLGVTELYSTFSASWLGNLGEGQARVLATMSYVDGSSERRLLTLQLEDDGQWRIGRVEPAP